jgi:TPR repeat protein
MYCYGQGVEKDEEKAFRYFKMAAEHPSKPNAYAQYQLGRMCADNPEEAEKWYRMAYQGFLRIEQEMPDDKLYYRLGSMNLHGIGTEKDLDLAREYLHKAAIMGNVDAVYGMGKLYLESDVQKAISMFELAAEQGNSYVEYQLGKIYCFGQGVPQNLEVGMEWLKASASHGNEYASALLEKVQNHIHQQTASAAFGLFRGLAGMIQTSANHFIRRRNSIDRKQRQKIEEKKQALGQRSSGQEYDYSEGQTM